MKPAPYVPRIDCLSGQDKIGKPLRFVNNDDYSG